MAPSLFSVLFKRHNPKFILQHVDYFVLACKLITKLQIQVNDFEKAHDLFILYANKFVELFGKEKCTFNMHLHLHIKEFILNFGQIYAGLSSPELFEQ